MAMIAAAGDTEGDGYSRTFLLLNLFGFPVAGIISRFLSKMIQIAGAPVWLLITIPLLIGAGLIITNIVLTRMGWRADGWSNKVISMAIWSLACIATLILFSTYSPLNLALALISNIVTS